MHVVYINTSLYTKASAQSKVPTITCTSSNVVQTVLQGFAQVGILAKGVSDYHGWTTPARMLLCFKQ
jgi:hypothetical protein